MRNPFPAKRLHTLAIVQIVLGLVGLTTTVILAVMLKTTSGNALDAAASAIDSTGRELTDLRGYIDDRKSCIEGVENNINEFDSDLTQQQPAVIANIQEVANNLHELGQDVAAIEGAIRAVGEKINSIGVPVAIDWHLSITWDHPFSGVKDRIDDLADQAKSYKKTLDDTEHNITHSSEAVDKTLDNVHNNLMNIKATVTRLRQQDMTNLEGNLEATRSSLLDFSSDIRSMKSVVWCATVLPFTLSILFICNGWSFRILAVFAEKIARDEPTTRTFSGEPAPPIS